jgi:hypothetical protein
MQPNDRLAALKRGYGPLWRAASSSSIIDMTRIICPQDHARRGDEQQPARHDPCTGGSSGDDTRHRALPLSSTCHPRLLAEPIWLLSEGFCCVWLLLVAHLRSSPFPPECRSWAESRHRVGDTGTEVWQLLLLFVLTDHVVHHHGAGYALKRQLTRRLDGYVVFDC